jgi:hypothetical protein
VTGHTGRSYSILDHHAPVVVAGRPITLEGLAASFQPQLFQEHGCYSPPPLKMWWEAIDSAGAIALVYHPVWQDERHPVTILHWVYYIYRAIVYGIPVRDIEYIQINIRRSDSLIQRIRYEGNTALSCNEWYGKHTFITINRQGSQYVKTTTVNNSSNAQAVQIDYPTLNLRIATWSHQFDLIENENKKGLYAIQMPLEYLTEEKYRKYKLARRSQGDFATKESIVGRVAKSIISVVILGVPYLLSQLRTDKQAE